MGKNVLFIGGGNMAEGIIRGILTNKILTADEIHVREIVPARAEYLKKELGLQMVDQVEGAVKNVEAVVLATRPQDSGEILEGLSKVLKKDQLLISICAGITIETMEGYLSSNQPIARVMPNVLGDVQTGFSGICINKAGEDQKDKVESLFSGLGDTMFINESQFDAFTAYACAGPAFVMHFITAMVDAGVHAGFNRNVAKQITFANMVGSVKTLEKSGRHPFEVVDTMTSPAGVTIEGVKYLEETAFKGDLMKSVAVSVDKAKELG